MDKGIVRKAKRLVDKSNSKSPENNLYATAASGSATMA